MRVLMTYLKKEFTEPLKKQILDFCFELLAAHHNKTSGEFMKKYSDDKLKKVTLKEVIQKVQKFEKMNKELKTEIDEEEKKVIEEIQIDQNKTKKNKIKSKSQRNPVSKRKTIVKVKIESKK